MVISMFDPAVIHETTSWSPSPDLIERIKRTYREAVHVDPLSPLDRLLKKASRILSGRKEPAMWDLLAWKKKDIHEALLRDDDSALALLSVPETTNLYYGVDNLTRDVISTLPQECESTSEGLRQLVQTLANAIGCKAIANPESDKPPAADARSTEQLLDEIGAEIGIKITFPNPFAGEFGIRTSRGLISYRALQALYQAFRLRQVCKLAGGNDCLEIGAGMGRTVFYAQELGLNCTIVDLPMTIVGQALFLGATLGEDQIWMAGDPEPVGERIRLVPANRMELLAKRYDAILNVDSLTEMDREVALSYLTLASKTSRFFISVNHEINPFTVHKLAKSVPSLLPLSRTPYWLRGGYVEELFAVL
jgi:putative sugar O-methyltransferase